MKYKSKKEIFKRISLFEVRFKGKKPSIKEFREIKSLEVFMRKYRKVEGIPFKLSDKPKIAVDYRLRDVYYLIHKDRVYYHTIKREKGRKAFHRIEASFYVMKKFLNRIDKSNLKIKLRVLRHKYPKKLRIEVTEYDHGRNWLYWAEVPLKCDRCGKEAKKLTHLKSFGTYLFCSKCAEKISNLKPKSEFMNILIEFDEKAEFEACYDGNRASCVLYRHNKEETTFYSMWHELMHHILQLRINNEASYKFDNIAHYNYPLFEELFSITEMKREAWSFPNSMEKNNEEKHKEFFIIDLKEIKAENDRKEKRSSN